MPSKTHGLSASSEYKIWQQMKNRCLNPHDWRYPRYGGRGIKVCDRWLQSFEAFLADMGRRPSTDYSLERIDNDRNYTPDNCCWILKREQGLNRRNTHLLTYSGETLPLSVWARRFDIGYATLFMRIKAGWLPERALTERPMARPVAYNGEICSVSEWARRYALSPKGLLRRLDAGWTVERALTEPPTKERDESGRYKAKR